MKSTETAQKEETTAIEHWEICATKTTFSKLGILCERNTDCWTKRIEEGKAADAFDVFVCADNCLKMAFSHGLLSYEQILHV